MNLGGFLGGKSEFIRRCEQLWDRRGDVAEAGRIVRKIVTFRLCEGCLDLLITNDPRITHCSHICGQRHRRFNEQLVKEEKKHAA